MAISRKQQQDLLKTLRIGGWLVVVFAAVMFMMSVVSQKKESKATEIITEIKPLPDGNSLINEGNIFKTIKKSFTYNLLAVPLVEVDVERVERVLEADPFIEDAEVYINANNQIHIYAEQREPILRIIDKNNLNYYLDIEGKKMPLSTNFTARVIVATGNIPPHDPNFLKRKKHTLKDVFDLTNLLLANDFYNALIEQIHVSNNGEVTLIPKVGRQKIQLGKFNDLEEKLWRLQVFYEEGMNQVGWSKYKTLDVRYAGQVIGRK
ncbi:MAG: cell division protein FtsQ/DivIB [Saprospiraceae bacterium]